MCDGYASRVVHLMCALHNLQKQEADLLCLAKADDDDGKASKRLTLSLARSAAFEIKASALSEAKDL